MAALSAAERQAILAEYASEVSHLREPLDVRKPDMIATIQAIDAWVDSNAASFNSAIPQPARGQLTARQKAHLLMYVVRRRFEVT